MKKDLLSSIIIAMLMTAGLSACDEKKADEQPVAQSADSSASNTQSTSSESADANDVLNQKLNVYIDCYNNLQADIYRAVNRYANTFDDFRAGPTGKEDDPSPLVPVYPAFIQDCRKDIKAAAELKPAFASLDSAALAFINAAGPLAETINSMNKYYDQDNFKDDAFAGAKAFHKTFIKQFDEFDPIAKKYIAEITIMSKQHAANEIKATEKKEGKSIKYYTLLTMQEAETLNDAVADASFDVAAVSKQLADFEEHTQKLNEKINVDIDKHRSFPGFISELEKFQGKVKKRIRRVRDNVAYTSHEQDYLNSGSGDMVDGSYEAVVKAYNELIDTYNGYHLEREF
ncbi:YiiG family protein [Salmonella enterica subsp. enterica serovar Tennessee]|uniref:DUF3829 domain-containing protein n=1 Tax=Salmonella enterica subsp. enterica serovar Tennessee TaxID=143221 RepID=A0A3G3E6F4_SALET|nr:YiiG family protein [Salmonella enterica]EDA3960261.1 DUF3829 domain-containing protein [Salmonella enterica subsp. enterica serovar Enteritidis]EDR0791652.1 YiiG family protein [Salmonella enterica subsp. enterica serovar Rissen str. 150]EDR6330893.1 YiiG family protein [Salmonella enterica subsp. enterica serovar Hillingdon]ESF20462.1 lipoprotein [Salmonella enterica subsp. enterica serovar Tennessee str. TXSC_TXSC08-21]AHN78402.1 membrane protein [Salmonella enterica subsp. enterica sero